MTSETRRDPSTDTLLTPENAALVVIDFQPTQVGSIRSMDQGLLARNAVTLARITKAFDMPVMLSTVDVAHGQAPTIPELKAVLADEAELDRTREGFEVHPAVDAVGGTSEEADRAGSGA